MTWIDLTDSELDSGSIVMERVGKALRGNPQAIMDQDAGAPQIGFEAISSQIASTSGSTSGQDNITLTPWAMFPHLSGDTENKNLIWLGHITDGASPDAPRFALGPSIAGSSSWQLDYRYFDDPASVDTWTTITDGQLNQDSPGEASLFQDLRDNQKAWAQKAASAPTPITARSALKTATYSTSGSIAGKPSLPSNVASIALNKGAFFVSSDSDNGHLLGVHITDVSDPDQPRFGLIGGTTTTNYDVDYRTFEGFVDPEAWTDITDTQLSSGKDFSVGLGIGFRDNALAVAKGGVGAPRFARSHLQTATASTAGGVAVVSIDLNAYSFFPMIHQANGFMQGLPDGQSGPDGPHFSLNEGTSYDVDNRYISP